MRREPILYIIWALFDGELPIGMSLSDNYMRAVESLMDWGIGHGRNILEPPYRLVKVVQEVH